MVVGVGGVNFKLVGGGGDGEVGCQYFRLDGGGGTPPPRPAYVSISMKVTISVDKNYIKLKEICSN